MTGKKPENLHRKGAKTVLRPRWWRQAASWLTCTVTSSPTCEPWVSACASRIETGNGLALLITLINLSNALDCSLDYIALRTDDPRPYFPDEIDDLTNMYQPENAHERALLVQLMNMVAAMPPDQQVQLLRLAESMTDQSAPGSISLLMRPDEPEVRVASKNQALDGVS